MKFITNIQVKLVAGLPGSDEFHTGKSGLPVPTVQMMERAEVVYNFVQKEQVKESSFWHCTNISKMHFWAEFSPPSTLNPFPLLTLYLIAHWIYLSRCVQIWFD